MALTEFFPQSDDADPSFDATPPLPAGNAVGLRHFHATDPSRDDISTGKRQFMVSVFYPATPDGAAPRVRLTHILGPKSAAALESIASKSNLDAAGKSAAFARLQSLALRAQSDLKPIAATSHPVLIYYPAGTSHRLSNGAVCEALASVGYIVFTLDAPRDAPIVVFPDGRMVPFVENNDENYIWPRVADVRFLLDQIDDLNTTGPFAGLLDLSRIGMFGHSRGGYLSNICAVEDDRIRAGVNMDGFLWGLYTEGTGLKKYPIEFQERARALKTPILRLRGDQSGEDAARRGFEEESQDFGGDFISVALHGFSHSDFATVPWLNGTLLNFAENAAQEPPSPERLELLAALLSDFFDTCLLKRRSHMKLFTARRAGMDVFSRCQE